MGTNPIFESDFDCLTEMSRAYLLLYNVALAAGWSSIAWATIREWSASKDLKHIYRATEKSLFLFQTMAILEIIHPIVGLVKTSVITTMFQVSSRLFIIWGVLGPVPRTQHSIGFILLLTAWSITEILRYRFTKCFFVIGSFGKP